MNLKYIKFFLILTQLHMATSIFAHDIVFTATEFTLSDTIYIASEPEYAPYCFVDENGEAAGFSIDLFQAAANAAGLEVNIKIGIWNQIKQDLTEGRIDALPLVGRTPEREAFYDFTMPYLSLHGAVFVRKGTTDINSLADLKNKSIVVMKGDNAEEFVRRESISNKIATTNTFEEAFTAVAKGHYDAVITQRVMGIKLLKDIGIKNVVPLDFHIPQFRQDFCFAVQKGNMQLLSRLDEGLSIIIANDTFEEIRDKWFGPSLKEKISFGDILRLGLFILIPLIIIIGSAAILLLRQEVRRRTGELKKTLQVLKVSEEKYRSIIINLMEGFYSVTLDGTLLDHNREFSRILKLDINKDHSGIKLPGFWQDPEDRKAYVEELLQNGFIRNHEVKAKKSDGTKIILQISSRIVKNEENEPIWIEGSFLDITERKQALDELYKLKNQLEETVEERTAELQEKQRKLLISNQELEAFTYSVSHDLRAPLRAIDGFAKFLVEDFADKLGDEGKRYLDVIRTNAAKMDKLILDLLSLSRVSRADMNIEKVEMSEIIESMFQEIASEEEKETFQLSVDEMPLVSCDIALIKQVWQNLISNALKYSAKSEIKKIEISSQENDDEIIFCIKDFGAGFDDTYVDKLFGVFQRLHGEEEFAGTGVGLAIVKRIVQHHGGRVWAEGKVDKGSAFYFSLPSR